MSSSESNPIRDAIAEAIGEHDTILFMKGTPEAPACGFSARTVAMLQSLEAPFAAVDILPDPRIRQELSAISGWPTIPQLFVGGELLGGCDIVTEMYESGELSEALGLLADRRSRRSPIGREDALAEPAPNGVQSSGLTQIENRLG
jgi:monothiol glutaredoxin